MRWRIFYRFVLLTAALTAPLYAGPISFGQWYEFSFTTPGVFARGCLPADPGGLDCVPGGSSVPLDTPPWTFIDPIQGAILTITDAFLRGDSFNVFDFGMLILTTPVVPIRGTCGADPDRCAADPQVSHGAVSLGAGPHSITISAQTTVLTLNAAYFRVDPVPEPGTFYLASSSLAVILFGLVWQKRCKRRSPGIQSKEEAQP